MGEDDRHLDFRVSVLLRPSRCGHRAMKLSRQPSRTVTTSLVEAILLSLAPFTALSCDQICGVPRNENGKNQTYRSASRDKDRSALLHANCAGGRSCDVRYSRRYHRQSGHASDIVEGPSLTQPRHWLCTAAMVLTPVLVPTKVLA